MALLWLGIGLFIACGAMDPREFGATDSEFWQYVWLFEEQTGVEVKDVPIAFANIEAGHAGECWHYYSLVGSYYEIAIDPQWWFENQNDVRREILISHELGHCVLHRDHTEAVIGFDQPASIMYPSIAPYDVQFFDANRVYYYAELTNPPPSKERINSHDFVTRGAP